MRIVSYVQRRHAQTLEKFSYLRAQPIPQIAIERNKRLIQ